MKVIILSGIPGAGKSTYAERRYPDAYVVSADSYFMVDGEYRFDPAGLPAAHGACLRDFTRALQAHEHATLVVDNTNISVAEIAPYAALALAYGADLRIVTVNADPENAWARNVHGVPAQSIRRMFDALNKRELPPWWPVEHV